MNTEHTRSETQDQSHTAGRLRRSLGLAAATVAIACMTVGFGSGTAGAYPWSKTVTIQGTATCGTPVANPDRAKARWVYIKASNGQKGFVTNGLGRYRYVLSIPAGKKVRVTVNYGSDTGKCHDIISYGRPVGPASVTSNLIKLSPNGEA